MPRKTGESVVVITGASSGIGRAAALEFARNGASLVLAARREQALEDLAEECRKAGAQALSAPTDMSDEKAVMELAQLALSTYGRIDTWVNNHGVALWGRFEETPMEDFRRVIEVDLFGTVYGARAALPVFREQGGGTLINLGSVVSRLSEPYATAYVVAKHGIHALGMSLRQELALSGDKDIHVCTVMPATIDTPLFQHAGNYTGRAAKAMQPVHTAQQVAETILRVSEHPRPEVFVGGVARAMWLQYIMAPRLTERLMARMFDKGHFQRDVKAPPSSGNLHQPAEEGTTVSGGWKPANGQSIGWKMAVGVAAVTSPVLTGFLWKRNQKKNILQRAMTAFK
jgi:short-subunit dehydrogenase